MDIQTIQGKVSVEINEFQRKCHELYTCFAMTEVGLKNTADIFLPSLLERPDALLFVSNVDPTVGKSQACIKVADFITYAQKNGHFGVSIASAMLVSLYALWDEHYRERIGHTVGLKKNEILCDVMGDVRNIRNWIVHNNSVVDRVQVFKKLPWKFDVGENIQITGERFAELMDEINQMKIYVAP